MKQTPQESLEHSTGKIVECAQFLRDTHAPYTESGADLRKHIFQLGYNAGRYSELTGRGREIYDKLIGPVRSGLANAWNLAVGLGVAWRDEVRASTASVLAVDDNTLTGDEDEALIQALQSYLARAGERDHEGAIFVLSGLIECAENTRDRHRRKAEALAAYQGS